ncbi:MULTISPECIES: hypothetical protein [unclassified Lentimonas]|uniref:pilus assembly PilX family protein n=1 Tax=unclassified Lentimonas TaxID=2630993 RepID=UPI00132AB65F|nr:MULTISPECIES: hypothetical protein [unclassified Lentimonas]CAA6677704.1 Unannotated [Lentimonas sp. CC4]CAA6684967.1 Unannotated [Lentimonas sp. CC6]CAA6691749.1 Unannotated [Lentimonas sp. CC19]CAA6696122.1 Unannotated [Lentimonas sp. CC10]CAA7070100.1 Unannotated [Lentimonas sp. CC11]
MNLPHKYALKRCSCQQGFALVIALSLMAFVLLLLLSITTLVQVESRSAASHMDQLEAEQAALLALNVAFGHLQEAAGADQRITATADVLSSAASSVGFEAADGNQQWVGVWNNSTTDHQVPTASRDEPSGSNPDGFLGWLISGDIIGVSDQLDLVATALTTDQSIVVFDSDDADESVRVPLVETDSNTAYAYWVEDEGVKASIQQLEVASSSSALNEPYSNPLVFGLSQGADFGQMGGGMASAIDYPIALGANEALLDNMAKVLSEEELALTASEDDEWVEDNRHGFTIHSQSLLTDARNGGFKQDLSLAFEMDDDRKGPNSLPFFNDSEDFVGDGSSRDLAKPETLTGALAKAPGQDFFSRYVFTYFPEGVSSNTNVRGPTWYLLRDYYNLYKRLNSSSSSLTLDAQPYYPNNPERTSGTYEFLEARFAKDKDPYIHEFRESNGYHHFQLSRGNYTPVMLGYRLIFSIASYDYDAATDTAKIAFAYDPIYYLWNPYDKSIRFENYKVQYFEDIPVVVEFEITDQGGTRKIEEVEVSTYLRENGWSGTGDDLYSFLLDPSGEVVLAPGEVRMFSAVNSQGDCYPGVSNITAMSGNILRIHPTAGEILVDGFNDATIKVDLGMHNKSASVDDFKNGRFQTTSYLVDNDDLADARTRSRTSTHPKTQFLSIQANSPKGAGEKVDTVELTVTGSNLSDRKSWLGYVDYMQKPANVDSAGEPTEIVAAFNPISITALGDIRVFPQRNRFLHLISETSLNSILPEEFNGAAYWGYEYSSAGSNYIPGFSIPSEPLTSLPQLRHGMLTPYTFENPRAVGNSYANPRLLQDQLFGPILGPNSTNGDRYDSTWLLNDALWDGYFFSGIAPKYSYSSGKYSSGGDDLEKAITRFFDADSDRYGNANLLPNIPEGESASSLATEYSDGDGYKEIGASMVMRGGFNINSTSVAAWAAILSGNRDLPMDYFAADTLSDGTDDADGVPFPKTQLPNADSTDPWSGFARLNPDLIWNDAGTPDDESDDTGLAVEIVNQIQERGPFMSLSDFVNRRLDTGESGKMGALQAAIKAAGINADVESNQGVPADYSTYYHNPDGGAGVTSGGINGFIEQADILQVIAPKIVPRSDTFRIRSYGESRSVDGSVVGKATCEVVVQRVAEYVDQDDDLMTLPDDLNAPNSRYGRRFKIVSFKWL